MKKVLSVVISIAMLLVMAVPSFAMQLSTEVPSEHTVTVNYNEGGYALINGKFCADGAEFKVNRFGEINLGVWLENRHHLNKITVNGVDVTDEYVYGNLKISDIAEDTHIDIVFGKCFDDPNDNCQMTNVEGTVYLGDNELKDAELNFDFGNATVTTDHSGRYKVYDIAEGKHFVTISKDGTVLANTSFVVVMTDDGDEVVLAVAQDGTQVVIVPTGTEWIYLDFYIVDKNGDGIPDKNPDDTDPGDPYNPDPVDPDNINKPDDGNKPNDGYDGGDEDKDNDGVIIKLGEKKRPVIIPNIPNTLAELLQNPVAMSSIMALSLFLFIIIFFKRKKDNEEEEEQPAV